MKQARPWMLANLKITCQFHAHPLHQNSVDIFWAEIYRVRLLLGPNLVHDYQITAYPHGVDVFTPRHIVRVYPKIQEVVLVNERFLGHQYIFSNHKTHTMYHMLYIVMSIRNVSIYPLCLTIWIVLSTWITFFIRYVICLILSCLSMMCSFILHALCFIMYCSFGLRPPSDVSYALYCHVHLCALYCLVYFDCVLSSVMPYALFFHVHLRYVLL
jgi:hypothetical protein